MLLWNYIYAICRAANKTYTQVNYFISQADVNCCANFFSPCIEIQQLRDKQAGASAEKKHSDIKKMSACECI